jgi:Fe-S-cluster containining protein
MVALRESDLSKAEGIEARARSWLAEFGPDFPGNATTGLLGDSEEDQAHFEVFANDAPCPALNPVTGLCDVYEWRPMACRVFGPPTRMGDGDALGCCELCFVGATETEIADCEMPVPFELEEQLLTQTGASGETVVAFALLR